ncbi:MAG TPA: cobalamin-binding protein [Thermoplasmata archaeon]|nr:cobalamin-binding protein [Thermoplasmata archaeon]
MRIVSLLPSATEIVFALGAGSDLVGRSDECDYPAPVRSLPAIMTPKVRDTDRPSREIDARVRASLASSESLYRLDLGLLAKLAPDVLLTQDLCRVCSVTDDEVRAACRAAGVSPEILSLSPRSLREVWESIETIGRSIGRAGAGRLLSEALAGRAARRRPRVAGGTDRPSVAVIEWVDPPILAGLWTPEIVAAAGGRAVGVPGGASARRVGWDDLARASPDLVIVSPCSFGVPRTRAEVADPSVRTGLSSLAPSLGTWLADEAYFSRPGPRLAYGIDLIEALLRGVPGGFPMPVERWPSGS